MSRAAPLQGVQELDGRIAALRIEIDLAATAVQRDPELDRLRVAAATASASMRDAETTAAQAEAEASTLQRRLRELDRRLYGGTVRNPQELLEMQRELEVLRARLGDVAEHALDLMQTAEDAQQGANAADAGVAQRQSLRDEQLGPLGLRLAALQEQLATAVADRDTLVRSVDAGDLALYTRVAARRKPAVVALAGDSCGGCHLPLSNEERRAVRTSDMLVQCANCDRILVT